MDVKVPYGTLNQIATLQTSERLMALLSERQSKLFAYLEERYGSDIRATVERMLSAFTTGMTAGQSIVDRMTSSEISWHTLKEAGVNDYLDALHVQALAASIAHGGNLQFAVHRDSRGRVAIRARWTGDIVPDSQEKA